MSMLWCNEIVITEQRVVFITLILMDLHIMCPDFRAYCRTEAPSTHFCVGLPNRDISSGKTSQKV